MKTNEEVDVYYKELGLTGRGTVAFTASELRARIQKQVAPFGTKFVDGKLIPLTEREGFERRREQLRVRDWITKSCRFDKYGAGCDDIKEDRYSLRDEGRNPNGDGESYAERNA